MKELETLIARAEKSVQSAKTYEELEKVRLKYLGKKGSLSDLLKDIGKLSAEERPKAGAAVNAAKERLLDQLQSKKRQFDDAALEGALYGGMRMDVTLPPRGMKIGTLHPTNQIADRFIDIFSGLGFVLAEGPEIEDTYHNFDALNMPVYHPARSDKDTFYFESGNALRVHTTTVEVRHMEKNKPPIKMVVYGRVYRRDVVDAGHSPMFHQFEGQLIDKNVSFSDLKGLLLDFARHFLEDENLKYRFRPSYFPFTEPSAELDIWFKEQNRWFEILGCGMLHPNVLKSSGIDPRQYKGYAFGGGMDRLAMLYYGIDHLKLLFDNDIRFLEQFS